MNDLQEFIFPQTTQDTLVVETYVPREPHTRSDLPVSGRPGDLSGDTGLSAPHQPSYVLITPVHNEEKFIGRMIESIASQTVLPGHWIIVDDGSTDSTPEIVKAYAK